MTKQLLVMLVIRGLCLAFLICLGSWVRAQSTADSGTVMILDPETLYTFSALDGRDFLQRQPLNLPEPLYEGVETGLIAIEFEILTSGKVSDVTSIPSLSTTRNLDMIQSALTAVANWRFRPLGPEVGANEEHVMVIVQFNYPESEYRYSADGRFIFKGLRNRQAISLPQPKPTFYYHGVVSVDMVLDESGRVIRMEDFRGAHSSSPVIPRLGILAYDAIKTWRFSPEIYTQARTEGPLEQVVEVTCLFPKRNAHSADHFTSDLSQAKTLQP